MVRILIGLLLGFILGVGGALHYLSSEGGNVQIMTTPQVHQLEAEVKQANQKIEGLAKKLEESASIMEKAAARFTVLEHQFEILRPSSPPEGSSLAPVPSTTKPMAEEPSSGTVPPPTESPSPS